MTGRSFWPALSALMAVTAGSVVLALALGNGSFGWPESAVDWQIVREIRLPRALAAFVVGGLLALAGALMQVLLRNPLADPYVLGISGGAAVAALATMVAGFGAFWVSVDAFAGALV